MKASDPEPESNLCNGFPPLGTSHCLTTSCGFTVMEDNYGEHHMSARHIHFVTSTPIESVSRFRTTNGKCIYDSDSDRVVISDACFILELNPQTLQCRHRHLNSRTGSKSIWRRGLGFASQGQLPSAYEPNNVMPPYRNRGGKTLFLSEQLRSERVL